MLINIVRLLKSSISTHLKNVYYLYLQYSYRKKASQINCEKPLKVVFFALFESTWKCDEVYKKMLDNPMFEPVILICPVINYGRDNMLKRIDECAAYYDKKGHSYIKAYDEKSDKYIDVRKDINPDIIFYTNPYYGLIDNRYFINNYPDILTIYLPYAFCNGNCFKENFDLAMMNRVWRFYVETPYHKKCAQIYGHVNGKNVVVAGQPCIESFIKGESTSDPWKIKDKKWKRIIWAPHHTLEPAFGLDFSCFLTYCDYFKSLCIAKEESIQVCFKPHPLLRNKLNELWGDEQTDAYYNWWTEQPNTMLSEGDYKDLFLTSDAMIHDSGSFVTEYLYVNKPVMRTLTNTDLKDMFNEFGLKCLENYYFAHNESDISQFVENVISGVDSKREQRTEFLNNVLLSKNGMPSDIIINDIIESVLNSRV